MSAIWLVEKSTVMTKLLYKKQIHSISVAMKNIDKFKNLNEIKSKLLKKYLLIQNHLNAIN